MLSASSSFAPLAAAALLVPWSQFVSAQGASGKIVAVNSATSFCLLLPRNPFETIGHSEGNAKSRCFGTSTSGAGNIPSNGVKSAHFVQTQYYTQITGYLDPGVIQLDTSDSGGQYDDASWGIEPTSHCQNFDRYLELVSGNGLFCIRCCKLRPGQSFDQADHDRNFPCFAGNDLAGCYANIPGDYGGGFSNDYKNVDPPSGGGGGGGSGGGGSGGDDNNNGRSEPPKTTQRPPPPPPPQPTTTTTTNPPAPTTTSTTTLPTTKATTTTAGNNISAASTDIPSAPSPTTTGNAGSSGRDNSGGLDLLVESKLSTVLMGLVSLGLIAIM
ncbi:hypothetical protein HDV05_004213 [Chytridiales sp. JEL 0842]|nr:hypothetical protein HDV05_004213 [Chytridiales sp. JEL 0842]